MPLIETPLGDQVPRRGNALTRLIGLVWLWLMGWRQVGAFPNVPKAIFLGMPHTSNMDGLVVAGVVLAMQMRIGLMAKDSLFKMPVVGWFFRWLGGIPVDRESSRNLVDFTVSKFQERDQLWLGISPEGTRHGSEKWKSGFYHIARQAGVPIVVIAFDYPSKELRVAKVLEPSGDYEADVEAILASMDNVTPRHPERMSKPLKDRRGMGA